MNNSLGDEKKSGTISESGGELKNFQKNKPQVTLKCKRHQPLPKAAHFSTRISRKFRRKNILVGEPTAARVESRERQSPDWRPD